MTQSLRERGSLDHRKSTPSFWLHHVVVIMDRCSVNWRSPPTIAPSYRLLRMQGEDHPERMQYLPGSAWESSKIELIVVELSYLFFFLPELAMTRMRSNPHRPLLCKCPLMVPERQMSERLILGTAGENRFFVSRHQSLISIVLNASTTRNFFFLDLPT